MEDVVGFLWCAIIVKFINGIGTHLASLDQVGKDDSVGPIDDDTLGVCRIFIFLVTFIFRFDVLPPCFKSCAHDGITLYAFSQMSSDTEFILAYESRDGSSGQYVAYECFLNLTGYQIVVDGGKHALKRSLPFRFESLHIVTSLDAIIIPFLLLCKFMLCIIINI